MSAQFHTHLSLVKQKPPPYISEEFPLCLSKRGAAPAPPTWRPGAPLGVSQGHCCWQTGVLLRVGAAAASRLAFGTGEREGRVWRRVSPTTNPEA